MEPKVTQRIIQKIIFKKYLTIVVCLIALCVLVPISYILIELSSTKIYSNIKVMDVNVGGLSKEEAIKKLNIYYANSKKERLTLLLGVNEGKEEFCFKDLNVIYNTKEAVENAYKLGRQGGVFKRIDDIVNINIKGRVVDIPISYNKNKLNDIIDKLEQKVYIKPKNDSYEIKNNRLFFSFGYNGKGVDRFKCIQDIERKIKEGHGGKIVFDIIELQPQKLDANSIPSQPKDATYIVRNNTIEYIPEKQGVVFDKKLFNYLLTKNRLKKQSFSIPIEVIEPEITVKDLKKLIFKDVLATFETYYGNSLQNRKENIRLAASAIGGIILAPGQEFSYNKIVGPRTAERGYKMAHVYFNGKVIDDYGGGICQVSTTLYNAVLKANLKVVERKNHVFTVDYVPPGMDATVSYNTIDFKFINNRDWPIKIANNSDENNVRFAILGTNLNPSEIVEYKSEIISEIPYEIEKVFDPTMPIGARRVIQRGKKGCIVKVYKVIKNNGEIVKQEYLYTNSYKPLKEIIQIGTKKVVISKENKNNMNM